MRVFILSTGRAGSKAIIEACKHITNFTSAHESKIDTIGQSRLDYPDNHIESDNRLSWFLGSLDEIYGDDAIYVHLKRDKKKTVESFNKRWDHLFSIIKSFSNGILNTPYQILSEAEKTKVCELYYDTVNNNIEHFLKDKTKTLTINLESINVDFKKFWVLIEAEGDLKKALLEFQKKHNKSKPRKINLRYRVKLIINSIFKN